MNCDEYGIISGRGRAKYLGVSTTKTFPGFYVRLYIDNHHDPLVYRLHPQLHNKSNADIKIWAGLATVLKYYHECLFDKDVHELIVKVYNSVYRINLLSNYIFSIHDMHSYNDGGNRNHVVLDIADCLKYYRNKNSQSTMDLVINDYEKVKETEQQTEKRDIVQELYTKLRNGELSYDQLEEIRTMANLAHKYDSFT